MATSEDIANYRLTDGIAVLAIDSPPVNALGHKVRIALQEGVARAIADESALAMVLICLGRTFFAGADVTEIGKPILPPLLGDVMAQFEVSPKPIVSAIHGTALGGGLELALAGHYRVAVPSAVVGLPEVALGLLPGAGGTQRLPRLIGVAAAIEVIGLGRHVTAPEARDLGLIDAIVPEDTLEDSAVAFARDLLKDDAALPRIRDMSTDLSIDQARPLLAAFRDRHPELFIGLKAAAGVLEAIEAAITLPFDRGIERERAISRALVASPESAAQRHLFFAERAAGKLPGAEREKPSGGSLAVIDSDGSFDEYVAALDRSDADVVVATRFLDRFEEMAGRVKRPETMVGVTEVENVTEIAVGARTLPSAALQVAALLRAKKRPAIFVTPAIGGVLERLKETIFASVAALVADGVPEGDIAAAGRAFGLPPSLLPAGDGIAQAAIEARLLQPILAETLALQDADVVMRGSDVDFAMVQAGLWPIWRGGPAFMAERLSRDATDAAASNADRGNA